MKIHLTGGKNFACLKEVKFMEVSQNAFELMAMDKWINYTSSCATSEKAKHLYFCLLNYEIYYIK